MAENKEMMGKKWKNWRIEGRKIDENKEMVEEKGRIKEKKEGRWNKTERR